MVSSNRWPRRAAYLLFGSLANPFVIFVNVLMVWGPLSTGRASELWLEWPAVPVWVGTGIVFFAALSGVQWLAIHLRTGLSFDAFVRLDRRAQLPYAPFLLVSTMLFQGIEMNVMGFIVVPLFVLALLVTVPLSWFITLSELGRFRLEDATRTTPAASAG